MRIVTALLAAALTLALTGCGDTEDRTPSDGLGPTVDLGDPRCALELDDNVTILPRRARGGDRADYRVPARLLRGRHDAALVRAAMATIWTVMDPASRAQQRQLDADQRAVYALAWGGDELAFGGFHHMYDNP